MHKNLVIVESPAKAKTIEKFLGGDYKVLSSYGHIRDLKKKDLGIDIENNFEPQYEIPTDKKKVVSELKAEAKKAETVWLASDEDREGEAISWHLYDVLGLKPENTKRIVFHEITKNAIQNAIQNPREIDINLVNAQQARRILDRIVGFELSPVLWRKIKPALSAGRVQSVAVRLIVEREREIRAFKSKASYRVTAVLETQDKNGELQEIRAELSKRFKTKEETTRFLEECKTSTFVIEDITTRPSKKHPAPPFTTSTLQQEAARKLGFSVAQTMMIAQRLYEAGHITYMRTDSVNLSTFAINECKEEITKTMGANYVKTRQFQTHSKGAQEAHEAIRPTHMQAEIIEGTSQEQRLYELIWKRTLASQMAEALLEKTTATIRVSDSKEKLVASGEVIKFDGFLRVYRESYDDEETQEDDNRILPPLSVGQSLNRKLITATERFTQGPYRFTEASLVRKLEELGIGRPSTYAPTISTIQNRDYVKKGDIEGVERTYNVLELDGDNIDDAIKTEMAGRERAKLYPTDVGMVVNDFLIEYFPQIMDYNFTATVEKEFDDIAEGKKEWNETLSTFYDHFHPLVEEALETQTEHRIGERMLGTHPQTGKPISVKIGRYGPVVQMGSSDDEEKPRFAQMRKGMSMETLTLEEAIELFKLPRSLGDFEEKEVKIGVGRFGPYVYHNAKYASLPKTLDPLEITLEEAIEVILAKREADAKKHIKSFAEEPEMQILNGRYGPYISYKKKNYKIPKDKVPAELSLEECLTIIKEQQENKGKSKRTTKRKTASKTGKTTKNSKKK